MSPCRTRIPESFTAGTEENFALRLVYYSGKNLAYSIGSWVSPRRVRDTELEKRKTPAPKWD
jgi:hypothetical protein